MTGRDKAAARRASLAALAEGRIDIAVGTHALFQESVAFADLGLAVVDEQHRFGVRQRLALASKGAAVDLLVMTATPIPRSLVLAYFGDMDVSALREKPPGRKPIDTRVLPIDRLDEVVAAFPRRSPRARAPTGFVRWSRRARRLTSRRPKTAPKRCAPSSATPSDSLMARWPGAEQRRGDGALSARRHAHPGRDHGGRGRRRRAGGDDHDRRAR